MKKDEVIKILNKYAFTDKLKNGVSVHESKFENIAIEIIEESKKSVNGCLFLEVVEALMDMVNQHCQYNGILSDDGLSANELAFGTLESLGFLKKKKGKYYLDWKYEYFKE